MKRAASKIDAFLTADDEQRYELVRDPNTRAEVERWMGAEAFAQFIEYAPGPAHLGAGPKNIIFAPGVMGSTLQSEGLGGVWWLDLVRARDKLNQLKLAHEGTSDADVDADIKPGAVDISYAPFRKVIATSGEFGGSVHFPYDWRKSPRLSATQLRDRILQSYEDYGKSVHLVGHSMGGLMIRTALMMHGTELWPKVGKIVFIGTPHYGSPSIAGYLKNHLWGWEELAVLGMFLNRETFRSLRGVLSLLPAPSGVYPGTRNGEAHPCANFEMYDAAEWKLDLDAAGTVHLQSVLDEVKQFHSDLHAWHGSLLQEHKDRMLMIAGVGEETLFRLEFDKVYWGLWDRTKKITERKSCDPDRDGDGRVPLASALLEDVTTRYVRSEHGGLPNVPAVTRDVLAWLTGGTLRLARTCGDALKGHLSADDESSPVPLLDGTARQKRYRDLPEYEHPRAEFRSKIEADLDAGRMPLVNLTKIL